MYTSPIALLSQTEQLSSQRSQAIIKHAMAAIALVGALAVAQPVWGQVLSGPGGGGGTGGGGLTGGIFLTGNTINSSSGVPADASLTISGLGGASVGMSGSVLLISGGAAGAATASLTALGNTTGLTSSQTQALTSGAISGAGIASVGYSNGTLVVSATSAASGSVINLFALGNTTGATSSTTATLSQLSFSAAGGASLGYSTTAAGAGVIIVSAPTTVASATSGAQIAIGNTTGATSSESTPVTAFNVSGAGGDSVGFSLGTMIVSGQPASATSMGKTAIGNTTGLTSSQSQALTSAVYSGAGGVSLGYSNNTMIISGATGGGGGGVLSRLVLQEWGQSSQTSSSIGNMTAVEPAPLQASQAFGNIHFIISTDSQAGFLGGASSAVSGSAAATAILSFVGVLYSESAANQFTSFISGVNPISINETLSESGTSWSESISISMSTDVGAAFTTSTSGTTGTTNYNSDWLAVSSIIRISGNLVVPMSVTSSVAPGFYLAGIGFSGMSTTTAGTNRLVTARFHPISFFNVTAPAVGGTIVLGQSFGVNVLPGLAGLMAASASSSFNTTDLGGQIGPVFMSLGLH